MLELVEILRLLSKIRNETSSKLGKVGFISDSHDTRSRALRMPNRKNRA